MARSLRRNEPFSLARRAVRFHVQRGDLHGRWWVGAGDVRQALRDRRATGPVASGEEVPDHVAGSSAVAGNCLIREFCIGCLR